MDDHAKAFFDKPNVCGAMSPLWSLAYKSYEAEFKAVVIDFLKLFRFPEMYAPIKQWFRDFYKYFSILGKLSYTGRDLAA